MIVIKYEDIIDTSGYVDYLQKIEGDLPSNALDFAGDKNHYDFYSRYCTHDLKFNRVEILNKENDIGYALYLDKNKFKHDKDLLIEYTGVTTFKLNRFEEDAESPMHDLIIDEVSFDEGLNQVVHELQFYGGEIHIVCRDLVARWT